MFSKFLALLLGSLTFGSFIASTLAECCPPRPCSPWTSWCSSTQGVEAFGCCGIGPCNIFCCNCDNGCVYFDHCPGASEKRDVTWPDWSGTPPATTSAAGTSASSNATCSPSASAQDCVLAKFDILDTNDDHKLSILEVLVGWVLVWGAGGESDMTDPADVAYLVEKFEKYDTNGDGYLTLAECAQKLA
ncbi:hypothetical protein PV11_07705 [Exophiala sideris]|uniref:EF-hand domain-containing protein n=1 Tax=Exophiala sideris TaxID=1016849 RepID=A0A0D1WYF2_9EURO|nr:hypothetical protein PV11_07705 [Exophiala sideris]